MKIFNNFQCFYHIHINIKEINKIKMQKKKNV